MLIHPDSQVEISLDGNPPGLYSLVHPQPLGPGSFSLSDSLTDAASPGIPNRVRFRLLKKGTVDVQDMSKRKYDEVLDFEVVLEWLPRYDHSVFQMDNLLPSGI